MVAERGSLRRKTRRCRRPCRASSPRGSTRSPPKEKALIQDAAVIGKVFWSGALAAMSEARALDGGGAACTRSSARSSCGGSGALVATRPSTRFAMCSFATLPTDRCRARPVPRSTAWRPSGSRCSRRTAKTAPRCWPITICAALEFARAAGQRGGPISERAFDRATGGGRHSCAERLRARRRILSRGARARRRRPSGDWASAPGLRPSALLVGLDGGRGRRSWKRRRGACSRPGSLPKPRAPRSCSTSSIGTGRAESRAAFRAGGRTGRERTQVARQGRRAHRPGASVTDDQDARRSSSSPETLAMAEELGSTASRGILNTLGVVRVRLGDREGLADIERSIGASAAARPKGCEASSISDDARRLGRARAQPRPLRAGCGA